MPISLDRPSLWERFWSKVDTTGGAEACWPWTGAMSKKRKGVAGWTFRGVFWVRAKKTGTRKNAGQRLVLAHRFSLCLLHGGVELDALLADYDLTHFEDGQRREAAHTCNNRICCNPTHLYWGTEDENRDDRFGHRATMAELPLEGMS